MTQRAEIRENYAIIFLPSSLTLSALSAIAFQESGGYLQFYKGRSPSRPWMTISVVVRNPIQASSVDGLGELECYLC